jgi:hypothetical protein
VVFGLENPKRVRTGHIYTYTHTLDNGQVPGLTAVRRNRRWTKTRTLTLFTDPGLSLTLSLSLSRGWIVSTWRPAVCPASGSISFGRHYAVFTPRFSSNVLRPLGAPFIRNRIASNVNTVHVLLANGINYYVICAKVFENIKTLWNRKSELDHHIVVSFEKFLIEKQKKN